MPSAFRSDLLRGYYIKFILSGLKKINPEGIT